MQFHDFKSVFFQKNNLLCHFLNFFNIKAITLINKAVNAGHYPRAAGPISGCGSTATTTGITRTPKSLVDSAALRGSRVKTTHYIQRLFKIEPIGSKESIRDNLTKVISRKLSVRVVRDFDGVVALLGKVPKTKCV